MWRWWRGGGMVGIGVGGGSRRSGEEEAGGVGRRQHHVLVAARLVTGGVCVCVVQLDFRLGSWKFANRSNLFHTFSVPTVAAPAAGSGEERSAPAEQAGGGTGKRRLRGEADAAGVAAKKKPRSVCPHQRERSTCVCECVCVCAGERERQYVRKTMAQRRKHASFSASSATKRGLTNIARPSSTKTARPHKEPL